MKLHLKATGCHLPYGITQCYLPLDTNEHVTQINSFKTSFYVVMLNLSSLLKSYWAVIMTIYFIQRPVKTMACITFYLLPSLLIMHYEKLVMAWH